jgi:CheY-like chemotaxis protein
MRILIVDDEDQMRALLRLMLEPAGHEVLDAANGKVALHLQKTMPADLVITDIIMPEMEGIELIRNIRKVTPHVKIIAISGGGKIDADLCLEIADKLGADRTLLKPFSKSDLLSVIGELFSEGDKIGR